MSWACTGIRTSRQVADRLGLKADWGMNSPLQDPQMPTNFDNFRLPRNLQFVARTNLAVPMATGVASAELPGYVGP